MTVKFSNNAIAALASAAGTSDTSLSLASGQGALFPSLSAGSIFYLTLGVPGATEIVKVTARATDALTVVRAQEGTTALAHPIGTVARLLVTAATLDAFCQTDDTRLSDRFPSGTRMPFAQASAPTGWTQDTSTDADNRMLRVVITAGGGVGGSHSPILNNVVPSHTHGFTTGNPSADHSHAGWTGGVNTNHVHGANRFSGGWASSGGQASGSWNGLIHGYTRDTDYMSADHAHYITTGGVSANHTHSGATDNGSSQTNWTPKYIDMIICTKA